MNIHPLSPLPHALGAPASTASATPSAQELAKAREVARDFEAIFVRQLLQPLEKVQSLGGKSNSGQQVYGSMMVGALADTATRGGGIGLADLIATALLPGVPSGTHSTSGPKTIGSEEKTKT